MSSPPILHVVLTLCPGGAERLVIDMARHQRQSGAVAVCCLDDPGEWARQVEDAGIPVFALHRAPGLHPSLGRAIAGVARRFGAATLHAHQYSPFLYASLARPFLPGVRLVVTEHGRLAGERASLKRRIGNRVLSRIPHAVVAVSHQLRRDLLREGYAASRVSVIHNGIDVTPAAGVLGRDTARARLGFTASDAVIGTVARIDPVKDLDTLLRAVAVLARERGNLRLAVIGDGPDRVALEREAEDLGLADRVRWAGTRDDARGLVEGFDVYVNSSRHEGVSVSILEAMACGVPVVATRVGGTPEIVDDGVHGLLVEAQRPGEIAAAVGSLLDDGARRRVLGETGRARVADRFSFARMIADYDRLYAAGAR